MSYEDDQDNNNNNDYVDREESGERYSHESAQSQFSSESKWKS